MKAAGRDGLTCVASLLANEKDDTFFLFDAASLLATFDRSGLSDSAIVSALSGTCGKRCAGQRVYVMLTADDLVAIREGRRRVIAGVSNEAIETYMEVSRMLLNLINTLDAYKDYRIH